MELSQQFELAVANSKMLPDKPSNNVLLQLYALYKQATTGDINIDPPSNPFDLVNKAKYKAWESVKGKMQQDAMKEYIDMVSMLQSAQS